MKEPNESKVRGLPLGKLNYLLAALTIAISVLLLYAAYRTSVGYKAMRESTEAYIEQQHSAYEMQVAFDYMTEQARCFVVTGDLIYLQHYFEEANVTRRWENAMDTLLATLNGTEASVRLKFATKQRAALMEREYYAMRLAVSVFGYDVSALPQEIQEIHLDARDAAASKQARSALANSMVLGETYLRKKAAIDENLQLCFQDMATRTEKQQSRAADELDMLMNRQELLVAALILLILAVVLLTSLLVIEPLLRGVQHIRREQPIPISGAYEFRFMARTYNLMYEANREKKERLAYEARHDKLTGLFNRSGYDFLMQNLELANAALLLIDIDKFKDVNDTYGHQTGDRVLARVASVLRENFRAEDYLCRVGGDEFAAVMLHSGPEVRDLIAGKVKTINDQLLHPADDLPPVSLSVGVAFGGARGGSGSIAKEADRALYQVKENGRCGCAFAA